MTGKTIEKPKTKKKRLSKGMRKHIRRLNKMRARRLFIANRSLCCARGDYPRMSEKMISLKANGQGIS